MRHRTEQPTDEDPTRPRLGRAQVVRAWAGVGTLAAIALTVALVATLFQGGFSTSVPVVVLSQRAGLVMNPDAKVKMRDISVGKVDFIEDRPNGMAAIHLTLDPSQISLIPEDVRVDLSPPTVFGAKFVELIPPARPARGRIRAGQVVSADHVTVEIDNIFQQLTEVLTSVEPGKLNAALNALSTGLSGRGAKLGHAASDADDLLTKFDPSMPALSHDLEVAPTVLRSYADAAPDLLDILRNVTQLGKTLSDEQKQLDQMLVSTIGLSEIGVDVLAPNRAPLAKLLHVLAPTTDLANQYNQALYCGVAGMLPLALTPPYKNPGVEILAGLMWGAERWHYPHNLPKVAATGGPQCTDMPRVPYQARPPFLITDTNGNPWEYNNPGILLNFAGLKDLLYGPIDGPPRNSAQIGQPG
jgi:phospholipid/cholesterol/gamma-HCH transport system substrate-binding protein